LKTRKTAGGKRGRVVAERKLTGKEARQMMKDGMEDGMKAKVQLKKPEKPRSPKKSTEQKYTRKIIFKHGRAIGDALMFSSGVRDFKLLFPEIGMNVESNFPALWQGNPFIDTSIKQGDPGVEFYRVGYPIINNANNSYTHFTMGFLLNMIATADAHKPLPLSVGEFCAAFSNGEVGDYEKGSAKNGDLNQAPEVFKMLKKKYGTGQKDGGLDFLPDHLKVLYGSRDRFCKIFARQRADIYLTEEEKSYSLVHDLQGKNIKYWIVSPGGKTDCTCKIWDWRRFQKVIDYFDGMLKFVIIGRGDHIVEKLKNVVDLTDKYNKDVRGLIPLVYHAEGCVTGVSFLLHLAAAVPPRFASERKPCVSIYGGREPTSFTAYCNHQILHTNGAFNCCDNGGCWQSRVIPIPTSPSRNTRLCEHAVTVDGRTIPACMDSITTEDVIRAIEKYYDGNIYSYMKSMDKKVSLVKVDPKKKAPMKKLERKEINVLASLNTRGGGEQSACKIVDVLRRAGWKVNFHPWDKVHENYSEIELNKYSLKNGMAENMQEGIPLLFYANDQIRPFLDEGQEIVEKSSMLIVGINYINSGLPKCRWLDKIGKLRAVIFQNIEKRDEFIKDQIGFEDTELITLFGAIELDEFLEVCPRKRERKEEPLVILKHCMPDWRKYVTEESARKGNKIHLWQKKFYKEPDTVFYSRMLKDIKDIRFEFMEAHKEIINFFEDEPRMVFHKFDSMEVTEFLERGHVYLYRTSNHWRDNYPRVVAEALASGLPVLSEPRDGTKDRIVHGVTGFYCVHYDEFLLNIKTLKRKRDLCYSMGAAAKEWARRNLDPEKWAEVLEKLCLKD